MSYTPPDHLALNRHVNNVVANYPIDLSLARAQWCQIGKRQIDLILDEAKELRDGIELSKQGAERQSDAYREIRDGIADVIVTLDGLVHRLGLNEPDFETLLAPGRPPVDKHEHEWLISHLQILEQTFTQLCENAEQAVDLQAIHERVADCYETVYDLARAWNVNIDADQLAVYESNMSKFDLDKATAMEGVLKYSALGVKTEIFPTELDGVAYYVIKCVEDCVDHQGKVHRAGKFLKSVNFREPVLT